MEMNKQLVIEIDVVTFVVFFFAVTYRQQKRKKWFTITERKLRAYQRMEHFTSMESNVIWLQLYLINNSEFSYKLLFISFVEQFSIGCRKTKTKVITLANRKVRRQSSEPIKSRSNRPFLYSRFRTGTSLQLRLMRGVFSNANKIYFFSIIFLRMSLHSKLVPVQYGGEYEYCLLHVADVKRGKTYANQSLLLLVYFWLDKNLARVQFFKAVA